MKIRIIAVVLLFCSISFIFCGCVANTNCEPLLRLHIRANSQSQADQDIKLVVRDKVNEYLCSLPASQSFEQAYNTVKSRLTKIKQIAEQTLSQNGFLYGAKAYLSNEYFPARTYDGYYVGEGFYDALIIELGEAKGQNFWCVIYPPLCYGVIDSAYKSYIAEWLQSLFKK